jgi:hypothetical protein
MSCVRLESKSAIRELRITTRRTRSFARSFPVKAPCSISEPLDCIFWKSIVMSLPNVVVGHEVMYDVFNDIHSHVRPPFNGADCDSPTTDVICSLNKYF